MVLRPPKITPNAAPIARLMIMCTINPTKALVLPASAATTGNIPMAAIRIPKARPPTTPPSAPATIRSVHFAACSAPVVPVIGAPPSSPEGMTSNLTESDGNRSGLPGL